MEALYCEYGMELLDHFAQDGATPHFASAELGIGADKKMILRRLGV